MAGVQQVADRPAFVTAGYDRAEATKPRPQTARVRNIVEVVAQELAFIERRELHIVDRAQAARRDELVVIDVGRIERCMRFHEAKEHGKAASADRGRVLEAAYADRPSRQQVDGPFADLLVADQRTIALRDITERLVGHVLRKAGIAMPRRIAAVHVLGENRRLRQAAMAKHPFPDRSRHIRVAVPGAASQHARDAIDLFPVPTLDPSRDIPATRTEEIGHAIPGNGPEIAFGPHITTSTRIPRLRNRQGILGPEHSVVGFGPVEDLAR